MQSTAVAAPVDPASSSLVQVLRAHGLLIGAVALYAGIAFSLSGLAGQSVGAEKAGALLGNFARMLPVMVYMVLMWRVVIMRSIRPPSAAAWLKEDIRQLVTDRHRLITGLVGFALMTVVMLSFGQMKRIIPVLHPFDWDTTFIAMDRALHFGIDPWKLVHAVLGHPWIITLITAAYNFWLFLVYFVLIVTCFSTSNPRLRMQYLIAFILTWAIGGNLVATIFSSVGPVYVERLGLGDTFAPLMQILQAHAATQPLTVIEVQDVLWGFYTGPDNLSSISAFPSMHVASSTLMAIYGWRISRLAGWALTIFATVIMFGSVLLAWHYAVDGYAGALIALACWPVAGWLVKRFGPAR